MRNARHLVPLVVLLFITVAQILAFVASVGSPGAMGVSSSWTSGGSTTVDLGNGQSIELGPGEALHRYILTEQGLVEWVQTTDALTASEYGNATNNFGDLKMSYSPGGGTVGTSASIPTGISWAGHYVEALVSGLTENRTWVMNPGFTSVVTPWTAGTSDAAGSSTPITRYLVDGHGTGDGCIELEIDSGSVSDPYQYDADDLAYYDQSFTVTRGQVVWAGFRMDYWGDTQDDTHYGMTGSFAIFVDVEGQNAYQLVFGDIPAEETWYASDMVVVPSSFFNLPGDTGISVRVGLSSKVSVGYTPEIGPRARIDDFELYLKTGATPANVNLLMNGETVTSDPGYGLGHIYQTPAVAWTTNPIPLNFTWTPSPSPPDPNRDIRVEFDLATNMFARRTDISTVWEISPTSFGERVRIQNGTGAFYSSYFYANIPTGYDNRYFFNVSLPFDRDVYFVAKPLAPSTNLTSGWNGGELGDGYVNVSTYDVATGAGRYGYWRMLSSSGNIISNLQMFDPDDSLWKQTVDLRSGDTTRVRAYLGSAYQNSVVNFSVYSPIGAEWLALSAPVDVSGYATTSAFAFAGDNASAGSWMIDAMSSDLGAAGSWLHTGFFKRPFTVTHASELIITYPDDAVGTWMTNVTYGDLLLVILKANDTDSGFLVPEGTLQFSWAAGTGTFDDSGTGEYTKVFDTSTLTGSGQFAMSLTWSRASYDTALASLTVNVNYAATLDSPQYPGIAGAIGTDQAFDVSFRNVNGTGITGATIACNWSVSYGVTSLGSGSYRLQLSGIGLPLGRYPVNVTARAAFVESQWMIMYVDVREIYNSVDYSANQLSIPLGEAQSFTLTWTNDDTGAPVTGGSTFIACNWTSASPQDYTVSETSAGVYNVTIYTDDSDPLTGIGESHNVVFLVERYQYQNHTFNIGVQIRSHNTLLVLDAPVDQTPYGSDIIVLVYFEDTDLSEPITNVTGNVMITVTSPTKPGLIFSIGPSSLGDGHYNITIAADQWATIGVKDLTITAEWTGTALKYYSKTVDTSVRVLGTDTDLYLEQAPTATYCLDDFVFTLVFYDNVNSTRISNSSGYVYLVITPLTTGHPVTQADFVISEIGTTGTYRLLLNSSNFLSVGTFTFEIDVLWAEGVSPLYENRTMSVTLIVLERPTYVDYLSAPATYFGLSTDFVFSYVDSLRSERIPWSGSLYVTLNDVGVDYEYGYNPTDRTFTFTINTTSLGGNGTFELHLNVTWVGTPFYQSIVNQVFSLTVNLRATQLSHESFQLPQYGNTVEIVFVYTDLVSGTTTGMTGTLSLNAYLSGYYTVVPLGDGMFRVVVDTYGFASDGIYDVTASILYTGANFQADASETFSVAILKRSTQLGYDSPDPAEYLNNVVFKLTYSDDSTGTGIAGASVAVSCDTAAQTLVLDTNFWVSYLGNGEYQVSVNTTALGSLDTFALNVSVSRSGSPYYLAASRTINARVVFRSTQLVMIQTPGDTAFLENVTFQFRFSDYATNVLITIGKGDIVLSHGVSHTVISSGNYMLVHSGSYYEVRFNSTILSASSLVTNWEIQLSVDVSLVEPYYAARSMTTRANTVERSTMVVFPLVQVTPYFDNLTILFTYTDYLSGLGIDGANAVISFVNITSPVYYLDSMGSGTYRILVPTEQFGETGIVFFSVTVEKTGIPFYNSRTVTDTPATIRMVQTSIIADAPSLGALPPGYPMIVNITLSDYDNNRPLTGATVTSTWTAVTGQSYDVLEVGDGMYRVTLNTTGLLAQKYTLEIQATKLYYVDAEVSVTVQPGSQSITIDMATTSYFGDWGEAIAISFEARQSLDNALIYGADATLLWEGNTYPFADLGNGTYYLELDTSLEDFGIYEPVISVSRPFYQTRQRTFSLVVVKGNGLVVPGLSVMNVVTTTTSSFWVYLNDTIRNVAISDASVTVEWNNTEYVMTYNGTAGYYVGEIDSSGFPIGPYVAIVRAIHDNVGFLEFMLDVNVAPIPTSLSLAGGELSLNLYYGETLHLVLEYNDTYFGGLVSGANLTYIIGGYYGSLAENGEGRYEGTFDTSLLGAQSVLLRITAARDNYARAMRTITVSIRALPTEIMSNTVTQSGYYGDSKSFVVTLVETVGNASLPGAQVTVLWAGTEAEVDDLGNGTYVIHLNINLIQARIYIIEVTMAIANYATAMIELNVVVQKTPAAIVGGSAVDVPWGMPAQVFYSVNNTLTGNNVTGLNGYANWEALGQDQLEVVDGLYVLDVPDDLTIGFYTITISFDTALYQIPQLVLTLQIRSIHTSVEVTNTTIKTSPGSALEITIRYLDLDNGLGISGVIPEVDFSGGNMTYFPERLRELDDGIYVLLFQVNGEGIFFIDVTFSKEHYDSQEIHFEVQSDPSGQQLLIQSLTMWGSLGIFGVAVIAIAWVKYYSIPKSIRIINKMLKALSAGKVPSAPRVTSRQAAIMTIVNDELRAIGLRKVPEDIDPEPVKAIVPEVNELLERLAAITGLGATELDAFRADLARMKASERPGFIREVIRQEEARRAEQLAGEAKPKKVVARPGEEILEYRPEEIEELRLKLQRKGIAPEEIDLIVEQAKTLSKADLTALLDSLGIDIG